MDYVNVGGQQLPVASNAQGERIIGINGQWLPYATNDSGVGMVANEGNWTVLHKPLAATRQPKPTNKTGGLLETAQDVSMSLGSGATFGFQDEIIGAIMSATGMDYEQARDVARKQQKQAKERSPIAANVAEIGGAIGTGTLTAPLALGKTPSVLRGAGAGVGEGSLAGLGFAEDNLLVDTLLGGAMGGVLGAAGVGLSKYLQGKDPTNQAGRKVKQAMKRDNVTLEDINQAFQAQKGTVPVDMGPNLMGLGRAIGNQPGKGRSTMETFLKARQALQQGNVAKSLAETTGGDPNFYKSAAKLAQQRSEIASPLYKQAHATALPVTDKTKGMFEGLLQDPDLKGVWNRTARLYRLKTGVEPDPAAMNKVQFWDYFKQSLDDEIDSAFRQGHGNLGSALQGKKQQLVGYMDEQVPAYAQARQVFSGNKKMENALEMGRKILRTDADLPDIQNLTKGEKDMFINGAVRAIRDKVMSGPETANQARNLIKSPLVKERLRNAFAKGKKGQAAYESFIDELKTLTKQGETFAAVTQGSRTAPVMAEMSDAGQTAIDLGVDVATGNTGQATMNAIRQVTNLIKKRKDIPDEVGEQIARLLTGSPSQLQAAMQPAQVNPLIGGLIATPGAGMSLIEQLLGNNRGNR